MITFAVTGLNFWLLTFVVTVLVVAMVLIAVYRSKPRTVATTQPGLMTCPACKKEVSTLAEKCAQCGHPLKRGFMGAPGAERQVNLVVLAVVLLVVLGTCTVIV